MESKMGLSLWNSSSSCSLCFAAIKIPCMLQRTRREPCHHSTSAVRWEDGVFYIYSELECSGGVAWRLGAAARHSRNTKALLGLPRRPFCQPADPFHQAFICAAGTLCPGGCPLGFWWTLQQHTCQTHRCPFFCHRYKVAAFVFFSSSKQQVCLFMEFFYLQSGTRIQRAWWCLQAWALPICHARCLLNFYHICPQPDTTRILSWTGMCLGEPRTTIRPYFSPLVY